MNTQVFHRFIDIFNKISEMRIVHDKIQDRILMKFSDFIQEKTLNLDKTENSPLALALA